MAAFRLCSVSDCDKAARGHGYCENHRRRHVLYGDPLGGRVAPGTLAKWIHDNADYDGDDCLIWPFGRTPAGYGYLKVRGHYTNASRYMREVANGPPPTPQHDAAHSCGRGGDACTNPRHLRWATRAENADDRWVHGTMGAGEKQGASKLTEGDVRQIRRLGERMTQAAIADRFGVSQGHVWRIIHRQEWAWLT